jgi:hypothetical protein
VVTPNATAPGPVWRRSASGEDADTAGEDGYRINANLGSEYDNNRWGRPVGDGTALAARLPLQRRGSYFGGITIGG